MMMVFIKGKAPWTQKINEHQNNPKKKREAAETLKKDLNKWLEATTKTNQYDLPLIISDVYKEIMKDKNDINCDEVRKLLRNCIIRMRSESLLS